MSEFEVILDGQRQPLRQTKLFEAAYLEEILRHASVGQRPVYVFTGFEPEPLRRRAVEPDAVAFIFDEQRAQYPEVVASAARVFQAYIGDADTLGPNHFAFPLGFARGFVPLAALPPSERPLNLFFSGNLHVGRAEFHAWLSGSRLPFAVRHRLQRLTHHRYDSTFAPSLIRFTGGFGQGLSGEAFSKAMASSRIALCPGGSRAVESYRFYEALLQGCVVVTERLPVRAAFASCPAVFVDRWSDATKVLTELLADPAGLDARAAAQREWFEREASPRVTAQRL